MSWGAVFTDSPRVLELWGGRYHTSPRLWFTLPSKPLGEPFGSENEADLCIPVLDLIHSFLS